MEQTTAEYRTLLLDVNNKIAHVRFNRPDKANAIDATGWEELEHIFKYLDERDDVRVIVLSGEGKHFCAGIDLQMLAGIAQQMPDMDEGRKREMIRRQVHRLQAPINAIEACRKPVLAAIHGACLGGAVDIISACDMRYCTTDTYFAIEEINIGMVADLGTLQRLPHLIGHGLMRELAYTGRRMQAEEAQASGLVNTTYDDRQALLAGIMDIAETIASRSPLAIRGTKQVLNYSRDHSVADGLEYIAVWNAAMLLSNDITEAMTARLAGRDPLFED